MANELTSTDALVQASFLIQGMLERRAGEHDISLIQTRLLGILRDRTPTINELAQVLGLDKSSTSGLVDRAQRRGLVRRVPSQLDRRSVRVRLTDAGREQVQAVAAGFAGDIATMLEPLAAEDRAALTRYLSEMLVAHAAAHGLDLFATGTA
jgi:MarR family transcriptional regulator, lower aerobic nicotinate degradation pathway regulator